VAVTPAARLRRRWSNLRALSLDEQRLLATAVVLLPAVAAANRTLGFRRVQAHLAHPGWRRLRRPATVEVPRVVEVVELAARRGPWRANCLQRSMVLWWALRRRGVDSAICFGVRPAGQGRTPDFHAWVELDGEVINDVPDVARTYLPLSHPSGGGSWR
jgi:hypothetical protein